MFSDTKSLTVLNPLSINGRGSVAAYATLLMLATVASYLMFAPVWSPTLLWWRYDNARLLEIGLLLAIGAMTAIPGVSCAISQRWIELNRGARALLILFCAAGVLSATLSGVPQVGVLQVSLAVLLLALTLSIVSVVRNAGARGEAALSVAICAGALLVVLQFWAEQAVYIAQGDTFPWVSPFLNFANVRFFSQYQTYALLLIVVPLQLFKLGRISSIALYVLAANFWSLQWMVGTRAVWVGLIAATLVVLLFGRGYRRQWIRQQSVGVAAGLAIFLVFTRLLMPTAEAPAIPKTHSMVERGWQSVNERVVMMKSAAEMIRENPILGVGPGQFGHNYSATRAAHPHNSPLQFLAEYGLIGGGAAIALLGMLGFFALGVIRAGPPGHTGDAVGVYVAAALIMGLVESCFSGNLTMPHSQIMFCVTAGWLLGRRRTQGQMTQFAAPETSRVLKLALSGTVLLAVGVALILTVEYATTIHGMPWWIHPNPPNLWQYGRFSAW
jgi:O-antigen ligase